MSGAAGQSSRLHAASLAVGVLVMLTASLYPPLFQRAGGAADHTLAALLFAAMSAGLVRGVGYLPALPLWRWMFSGWSCALFLLLAGGVKTLRG